MRLVYCLHRKVEISYNRIGILFMQYLQKSPLFCKTGNANIWLHAYRPNMDRSAYEKNVEKMMNFRSFWLYVLSTFHIENRKSKMADFISLPVPTTHARVTCIQMDEWQIEGIHVALVIIITSYGQPLPAVLDRRNHSEVPERGSQRRLLVEH